MKNTLILVLLVAVLALGYFLIKKDAPDYVAPEDLGDVELGGGGEGSAISLDPPTEKSIFEENEVYKIDAKYPVFGSENIDSIIKNDIQKEIANFKSENSEPYPGQSAKYLFATNYRVERSDDTVTVILNLETYSGGAHSNLVIKTFNYSNDSSKITLGSLFKSGSQYLSKLSVISRAKLEEKIGTQGTWIDDGTEPVSQNFEAFYITDAGLNIIFQPYQIAPWVNGAPVILISFDELKDVLNESR